MFLKNKILILFLVIAIGFLLRFYGSWYPYFIDDDTDWIVIANAISFAPQNINLLPFGSGHGPLTAYILKIGGFLFGNDAFGMRVPSVIFGTTLIYLIYFLVNKALGFRTAVTAALLAGLNIMLIFFSQYACDDIFHVFFFTGCFTFFWMALQTNSRRYAMLTGLFTGLSILTKETTILLLPVFFLFLVSNKQYRHWLKDKYLYFSVLLAMLVSSPYLIWLIKHNFFFFIPEVKEGGQWFGFMNFPDAITYLFLGYPLGPFHLDYTLGYYRNDFSMGIILLAGTFFSLKNLQDDFIRLMALIVAAFLASEAIFFDGLPRQFVAMLIPAIILTAHTVVRFYSMNALCKLMCLAFLGFFLVNAILFTTNLNDRYFPRHSRIDLVMNGKHLSTDANIIAKEIMSIADEFSPSLIVLPDAELDPVDNFVTSHYGIKTIGTSPENKYIPYSPQELERIVVISSAEKNIYLYYIWGEKYKYSLEVIRKEAYISGNNIPLYVLSMNKSKISIMDDDAVPALVGLSMPF